MKVMCKFGLFMARAWNKRRKLLLLFLSALYTIFNVVFFLKLQASSLFEFVNSVLDLLEV